MDNLIEKSNKRVAGATLVEILIAISLASLVMLPMIMIFGVTEKVTYKSINEVVACNLALQKIEELKSRPFQDLRPLSRELDVIHRRHPLQDAGHYGILRNQVVNEHARHHLPRPDYRKTPHLQE